MRLVLLFISTLLLLVTGVYAQTESELSNKVDSINRQIKDLEKEISLYSTNVTKTQGEAKTLREALARLEDQKRLLEKRASYTKLQVGKTREDIIVTESKVNEAKKDITTQKNGMKELLNSLRQAQVGSGDIFQNLLSQKSFSDGINFSFQVERVSKELKDKAKRLEETKNNLENEKAVYEKKSEELAVLQKTLTAQQEGVLQTAEEKSLLLKKTKNKEAEFQKLLKEKKVRRDQLSKEVTDFEAKLKAVIDATKIPKFGTGALSYPVEKVTITQYFGNTAFATANSQVYSGRGHNGIDFGLPTGSKILSAQDGTVIGIGDTDRSCSGASYGKWMLIRHTNGLTTLYAHLSRFIASEQQFVKRGEVIALSGNTGYSTGPHLHFTVYASDAVYITGPTEYKSRACGTYLIMPVSPTGGYLNPLSFFK
jgi:murein DD-endopeptidase MepM/ murein hydrolase activator NlpD